MSFTAFPDPDSGDQVLGRSIAEWDEMINSERGFLALTSLSVDSDAACQLLPLLHRALLEGDADMRLSVLTTLASVGEPARRVVPAILDVVRSGTLSYRLSLICCWRLSRSGSCCRRPYFTGERPATRKRRGRLLRRRCAAPIRNCRRSRVRRLENWVTPRLRMTC